MDEKEDSHMPSLHVWSFERHPEDGGVYVLFGKDEIEAYGHFKMQVAAMRQIMVEEGLEFADDETEGSICDVTLSEFEAEVVLQATVEHNKEANTCTIVSEFEPILIV